MFFHITDAACLQSVDPAPTSEVQAQVSALCGSVAATRRSLEKLMTRLEPVLRPNACAGDASAESPKVAVNSCSLTLQVSAICGQVDELQAQLYDVSRRLAI